MLPVVQGSSSFHGGKTISLQIHRLPLLTDEESWSHELRAREESSASSDPFSQQSQHTHIHTGGKIHTQKQKPLTKAVAGRAQACNKPCS